MRSVVLSVVLALGAFGLSLASPAQVRAAEHRGPAYTGDTIPVAHWRGHTHWRGGYYPGYGYGYSRGYYPYGYGGFGRYGYGGLGTYGYGGYGAYGGYGRSFYPRVYGGGYFPYGGRYNLGPYSSFFYTPGYFR